MNHIATYALTNQYEEIAFSSIKRKSHHLERSWHFLFSASNYFLAVFGFTLAL